MKKTSKKTNPQNIDPKEKTGNNPANPTNNKKIDQKEKNMEKSLKKYIDPNNPKRLMWLEIVYAFEQNDEIVPELLELVYNFLAPQLLGNVDDPDEKGKKFHKMGGLSKDYTKQYILGILDHLLRHTKTSSPLQNWRDNPSKIIWAMMIDTFLDPSKINPSPTNTSNYLQSFRNMIMLLEGKLEDIMKVLNKYVNNLWGITNQVKDMTVDEKRQWLLDSGKIDKDFVKTFSDKDIAAMFKTMNKLQKNHQTKNVDADDESDE